MKNVAFALGLGALACAAALAQDPATGEGPRIYTNADLLERFGPADPVAGAPPPQDDEGWRFVADHLEREYARLDAERVYEIEERARAGEDERLDRSATYAWPFAWLPYGGYGDHDHRGRRPHPGPRRAFDAFAAIGPGGIRPLHARPSMAEIQRAVAMRHRGADAFPH